MSFKHWVELKAPTWALDRYRSFKFRHGFKKGLQTWSQEGEDMILRRILNRHPGFYVDVGAHHPFRYSNTFYLYRKGWRGINFDALPEAIALFDKARPRDINVNVGVASVCGSMRYFEFNDPAFNTFDEELAQRVDAMGGHARLSKVVDVKTMRLVDLLDSNLPSGCRIDLMNVDVEGMDMDVLQSNDWSKYRPGVLVVEIQWKSIEEVLATDVYRYLSDCGYLLYSKCVNTAIFTDSRNEHAAACSGSVTRF
jgi:FkbM family methyltransferase